MHAELFVPFFQNHGSFSHISSLKRSCWSLHSQVTHYLTAVNLKNNGWKIFIFNRGSPVGLAECGNVAFFAMIFMV